MAPLSIPARAQILPLCLLPSPLFLTIHNGVQMKNNIKISTFPRDIFILIEDSKDFESFTEKTEVQIIKFQILGSVLSIKSSLISP
jgi:hypothetical protein